MSFKDALGYYQILGVLPTSDPSEIKQKYRDLAKYWHPDHNDAEDALENFQKISVAYDTLYTEENKLIYDLFSQIYNQNNYPQMDNLTVIKDVEQKDNIFARVINLRTVTGKLIKTDKKDEQIVCSFKQAKEAVLKSSLHNWLLGWWSVRGVLQNFRAIVRNIANIGNNKQDNLLLLVHNAVVFYKNADKDRAFVLAKQALDFATKECQPYLEKFIAILGVNLKFNSPKWSNSQLKIYQLIVPFLFSMLLSYPFLGSINLSKYMNKDNEIIYFQKVKFSSGQETMDDVVVSKIFNIPVDVNDVSKLYHTKGVAKVMYGPNKKFDVMVELNKGHTLRVTGFTPDKIWYRVMLDNGDMGFLLAEELLKGEGTAIPAHSKIFEKEE